LSKRFASVEDLLKAGETALGTSSWIEVTPEDVRLFADATNDHQWIHLDAERAKAGPYGTTVAHGYLVLALAAPMLFELFAVDGTSAAINYGLNRVRFPAALPVGSKVRGTARLLSCTPKAGGAEAVIGLSYELESGGKPPCVAEVVVLVVP
jgi:acyl dehydratase